MFNVVNMKNYRRPNISTLHSSDLELKGQAIIPDSVAWILVN